VRAILEALGGRPVLLPIEARQKGPFYDGWQTLSWEQTQEAATPIEFKRRVKDSLNKPVLDEQGQEKREVYRSTTYGALLAGVVANGGNLGVLLGTPSRLKIALDGSEYALCTIDVDDDDATALMLAANPWLERTLRTRGSRGCNFWLWVERESYEASTRKIFFAGKDGAEDAARPFGEWRSDGGQTVIWGIHPKGMRYARVGEARAPARCKFAEIVWPAELACPWWRKTPWDSLVDDYGLPWSETKKGVLILNPPFFVGKYALEHEVLYEPDEAEFYQYGAERGLWEKKSRDAIQWEQTTDFKGIADQAGKPALLQKRTNTFLRGLVQQLAGAVEERGAFEREAGLIHLANCVLDLRVDPPKTHSFRSSFRSRNQVPVALDEDARCDLFLNELVQSAVSGEDADLLQRVGGALLLGPNIAQRFALLYGTAGAGKSTWINLMRMMIGEANCTQLRTKHLEERFELFFYIGKTLLIGPDVPGDFMQEDGAHVIKALVGGDPLTAERKQGGEAIQLRGTYNILLSCNSRLRIKLDGDSDAWRRRMLPILYNRPKPKKPDPLFLEKLFQSEASGILNWMIEGARRLLVEFKEVGGYRLSAVHEERIDSLLAESDSVRHFVRHAVAPRDMETVTLQELADAYTSFCEGKGWRAESFKRAQASMIDAVQEIHRMTPRNDIMRATGAMGEKKSQRGYKGLHLLPPERGGSAPNEQESLDV
jgi:P4 family phage/plasmid primase-like protien